MKINIWCQIEKNGLGFVCKLKTPYNNNKNDIFIESGYRLFRIDAEIPMEIETQVNANQVEEEKSDGGN